VFISAIIYIGVYKEPSIPLYWNINLDKGLVYIIVKYILQRCFK
jgi:hypothetical protein